MKAYEELKISKNEPGKWKGGMAWQGENSRNREQYV